MSEILDHCTINLEDYETVEENLNNDFNISLSIVKDNENNLYLKRVYEKLNVVDQTNFFRDLLFSLHCKHPLVSEFMGFTFFSENTVNNFVIISKFPENGFLMDYINESKEGKKPKFNGTQKSIYLFGTAIIGSFLHSRGVAHRCFAPPSLGVGHDLQPTLLTFCTSKSLDQKLNETLQVGNLCWLSPEQEINDMDYDKDANFGIDVFSFGSLLYYLFTEEVPFYSENIFEISQKKQNAVKLVPRGMNDEMAELLKMCWDPDISKRPNFKQILVKLQSPQCLFPDTNKEEFDLYIQSIFRVEMSSNICTIAPPNLKKSITNIYATLITDPETRKKPEVLNALYTIREQVESYIPIILQCYRRRNNDHSINLQPTWISVPPFMFIQSLKEDNIQKLYGIPPEFQIIEIGDDYLADKPYLTIEQQEIKNGCSIHIYNAITDKKYVGLSTITLNIQHLGEFQTSYNPNDTVCNLLNDISFFTRIPINQINIKVGRQSFDVHCNKTLNEIGIKENGNIDVITSYDVTGSYIDIDVDLDGVLGKSGCKTIKITPITTFAEIMKRLKVDSSGCFAVYDEKELSPYKALIDYGITDASHPIVIELNTLIPDD